MNTKKFTVMFYEVGKDPEVQEWPDGDLETMKICVNGYIECIPHPLKKDLVIVMNREGKLSEDPPNRHLYREGKIRNTIVGDFFVCRKHREDLVSLILILIGGSLLLKNLISCFNLNSCRMKTGNYFLNLPEI